MNGGLAFIRNPINLGKSWFAAKPPSMDIATITRGGVYLRRNGFATKMIVLANSLMVLSIKVPE